MFVLNFRSSRICFNADIITIRQFFSPLSMIFSTIGRLSFASSSLAAVIQICRSVGIFSRALFKTCIINHFINVSSVARSKGNCLKKSFFAARVIRAKIVIGVNFCVPLLFIIINHGSHSSFPTFLAFS